MCHCIFIHFSFDDLQERDDPMSIGQLLASLNTTSAGLDRAQRKLLREQYGLNKITSPNNCPVWLCCLLPCLKKTKKMKCYNECIPDYAEVKIDNNWVKIDPIGVVVGDIVKLTPGSHVPADIRIIEVICVTVIYYLLT
jgi:hypothetical protein